MTSDLIGTHDSLDGDHASPAGGPPESAARPGSDVEPTDGASWRLSRRLGQFFTALALLVTALVVLIVLFGAQFVIAGNEVIYRWQPAQLTSVRVLNDLVNQETGLRGYMLTHKRGNLQPYVEFRPQQSIDTARLEQLVAHDPELTPLLRRFEHQAQVWHANFAVPVIRELDRGGPATTDESDAGRARFDRIRVAAANLDNALGDRAAAAQQGRVRSGVVAAVAIGIGVLLVAAAGALLWRGLHRWVLRPVDWLAAQTRAVASGELTRTITPRGPQELVDLGSDVEAMRSQIVAELSRAERITENLRVQSAELERSNSDLQQFAYVASHDLSEPLRKVANFCQLLERQYGGQLDDRARQYIDFAVDGAKRMQALINDLLSLSRVGRSTESFVQVDLDLALTQAMSTLSDRIRSAGATVERLTPLPTVPGDKSLLTSLLENLVGNAIKYHRDDVAPVVTVSAAALTGGSGWSLTVSDNGIGIDPQYAERIFAVFQRLHVRDQYGGTGIGLALCRRIVEFHAGRIYLDTESVTAQPGCGATFTFTLPEGNPRAEHLR